MSTFYDPSTIRRLAATGDPFYRGAAWVLDQQDAARIDTTDYDAEWTVSDLRPYSERLAAYMESSAALADHEDNTRSTGE